MPDNAARRCFAVLASALTLCGMAGAMAAPPGATHHPTQRIGTIVDSRATPAPSGLRDVLVTSGHCLASTRFDSGLVVTRKLLDNGELGPQLSSAGVGTAPRAIVRPGNGRTLVVPNSGSGDVSVMEVDDDCGLTDRGRVPSGGDDPFHAATAFDHLVVVAHRGSDSVDVFQLLPNGDLVPIDDAPTGAAPHVVGISPRGLVAVANSESDDLTIFELGRDGTLREVRRSRPLQGPPKSAPQRADDDKALSIDATTGRRVIDPDDPPGFVPGALAFSPDDARSSSPRGLRSRASRIASTASPSPPTAS